MTEPRPAATPTVQVLPLFDLTPERFQSFCRDLITALPEIVECHQYGVSGNPQLGIDLVATTTSGDIVSHQCRRVQIFDPADLRKLASDVKYEASHFYALIACRATSSVRDEEKKHERWTVWDVDDISAQVRRLPQETARRLVLTNFGGRWCRDFLGIEPFTAFLLPDDFFSPLLDVRKIFNHSFPLVGRKTELDEMQRFVDDPEKRILVLPGRGGIGKSKVLQAFADAAKATHTVLFAQLDIDITPEALSELPLSPLVIVVDDAHRREDLGLLFAYAIRKRVKLVLSTRPQLLDDLPSLAARHHVDPGEMQQLQSLSPLPRQDVETLAREILGANLQHLARELAAVTWDCSLITVVGGYLLRERRVTPSLLADDDQFRETALARFFDEVVEHAKPGSQERALRTLLEVIAALAPVQVQTDRFASPAMALTGMDYATVSEWCTTLERHGVLVARHDGLRIVPDLLSDYILGVACARPAAAGERFVDRVVAAVEGFDTSLLRNLAAVDWRVGAKKGQELQVLGSVWQTVVDEFKNAPNSQRLQMLRQLRDVGFFLPRQMLDLAKMAIDFPATAPESEPYAGMLKTSHDEVLSLLPETVRFTAYNPTTFDSACDFLWRLANDTRIPVPRPGAGDKSALSILCEAMAPSIRKPQWVHYKLMERVEAWLKIAATPFEHRGIVRTVASLLAKTGEDVFSEDDDLKLTIQRFGLPVNYLRNLRDRAIEIIAEALTHSQRGVVSAGVKALEDVARRAIAFGDLNLSDDYRTSWKPERLVAFEHLQRLAARTNDPVIGVQIRQAIAWYADDDNSAEDEDIREAGKRVLAALHTELPDRIARFVKNPWGNLRHRDLEGEQAETTRRMAETAREVVTTMTPKDAVLMLSDIIAGLSELGLHPVPGHFLSAIAQADEEFTASMCELISKDDRLSLAGYAQSLLLPLRKSNLTRFQELLSQIVASDACNMAAAVAAGYMWWVPGSEFSETDRKNIERLWQMDAVVAVAALESVHYLATHHPRTAAALVLAFDVAGDQQRAEKFAETFRDPDHRLLDTLSDAELTACVMKLETVPRLDGTAVSKFLEDCGKRLPLVVLDLLARRIERENDEDFIRYTAIPFNSPDIVLSDDTVARPEYKQLLIRIKDGYSSGRAYDAPRLFAIAAGGMNATAVAFLRETSGEQTDTALTFIANCLRGAPVRQLILTDAGFVTALISDASAVGGDTLEMMEDALLGCVVPRTTSQELRDDIERRASEARDHLPIASRARDLYDTIVAKVQRINLTSQAGTVEQDMGADDEYDG